MSNAKYQRDGWVDGLNESHIKIMSLYKPKEIAKHLDISYYLVRKALRGESLPRSIYNTLIDFLESRK